MPADRGHVCRDLSSLRSGAIGSSMAAQKSWFRLPRFYHMNKVKNYAVYQTFEMDLQNVWLDA
jgi:hypothetical protein